MTNGEVGEFLFVFVSKGVEPEVCNCFGGSCC